MNHRVWLCLLLSASLSIDSSRCATGQTIIIERPSFIGQPKESHHELPGELDMKGAQEMMAERLRELQKLHQLQDQVRNLLKNPDIVKQIQQNFSDEELQKLQETFRQGNGPGGDSDLDKLFRQVASQGKLNERHLKILHRLAERSGNQQMPSPINPNPRNDHVPSPHPDHSSGSGPSNLRTPPSPMRPPERSLLDRMQGETEKWLSQHMENMSDDMVRALTDVRAAEEGTPLAELLRALKQANLSTDGLAEPAAGLSRYLPDMGDFLNDQRDNWDGVRSLFREVSVPALPGLDRAPSATSMPSAEPADGSAPAVVVLTLLTLGVFLLLVWKMGGSLKGTGDAGDWRLGPWPVPPGSIATRQDLVHAFEYVALLCLGPQASTCHHRELAGRLAEQDADNPTRRQSVELLAWLYEQARYAPAGETLSPEELTDARHALCYLAGVTAA
jgi:hypothetical protein